MRAMLRKFGFALACGSICLLPQADSMAKDGTKSKGKGVAARELDIETFLKMAFEDKDKARDKRAGGSIEKELHGVTADPTKKILKLQFKLSKKATKDGKFDEKNAQKELDKITGQAFGELMKSFSGQYEEMIDQTLEESFKKSEADDKKRLKKWGRKTIQPINEVMNDLFEDIEDKIEDSAKGKISSAKMFEDLTKLVEDAHADVEDAHEKANDHFDDLEESLEELDDPKDIKAVFKHLDKLSGEGKESTKKLFAKVLKSWQKSLEDGEFVDKASRRELRQLKKAIEQSLEEIEDSM